MGVSKGKVIALESSQGTVVWTKNLIPFLTTKGFIESGCQIESTQLHVLNHSHEIIIFVTNKNGETMMVHLNPREGHVESSKLQKKQIKSMQKVHIGNQETLILVDEDSQVSMYPTEFTQDKFDQIDISFYTMGESSEGNSELQGFQLTKAGLSFKWNIPLKNQEIVAHSSSPVPELAHLKSQKHINLRGNIVFKYMESSLLSNATHKKTERGEELVVYLIEGSSGSIVHQFYERGVVLEQPINLLFEENSLFVAFRREIKSGVSQQ